MEPCGVYLYPLIACLIAVALSSIEFLGEYEPLRVREIFGGFYYILFVLINSAFCLLVYFLIPELKSVIQAPDSFFQNPARMFVAAFGYQVFARTSLFDIKVKGETVGIGFDYLYKGISFYLLGHHKGKLREIQRNDFLAAYNADQPDFELAVFCHAALAMIKTLPADKVEEAQELLRVVLLDHAPPDIVCYSLYMSLRKCCHDKSSAATQLAASRNILQKDPRTLHDVQQNFRWRQDTNGTTP